MCAVRGRLDVPKGTGGTGTDPAAPAPSTLQLCDPSKPVTAPCLRFPTRKPGRQRPHRSLLNGSTFADTRKAVSFTATIQRWPLPGPAAAAPRRSLGPCWSPTPSSPNSDLPGAHVSGERAWGPRALPTEPTQLQDAAVLSSRGP